MCEIQASSRAFAAIRSDECVVTWGGAVFGGSSAAVHPLLKNVQRIQANHSAFAAILCDGTWGHAD